MFYAFYLFLVEKENMHDIFNLVSIFILYFIAIKRYLSWCLQGHHILFLSKQMWLFTTKEVFRFYFSLPRCIICPLYCAYVNIRLHTYTLCIQLTFIVAITMAEYYCTFKSSYLKMLYIHEYK